MSRFLDYFNPWSYASKNTKKTLDSRKKAEGTKLKQALAQAKQRSKARYYS